MARPLALTLPWLLAGCAAAHAPRPGIQRCREVDTQLYDEARPRVEATMQHLPRLELHETHFVRDGLECSVAGLYPLRCMDIIARLKPGPGFEAAVLQSMRSTRTMH